MSTNKKPLHLCEMPVDAPFIHKIAKALINRQLSSKYSFLSKNEDNDSDATTITNPSERDRPANSDLDFSLKFEHIESEKRLLSPLFDYFPKIMSSAKYVKPKSRDGKSLDPKKAIDSHKRLKSEFYTEGTIKKCLASNRLSKDEILQFLLKDKENAPATTTDGLCENLSSFSWSTKPYCYDYEIYRESIFFAGRYNKFSRTLPQTPWNLYNDEGEFVEKLAETSVQELLKKPFLNEFYPEKVNLCASGREDVDVRMLGRGRPFTLEFCNCRFNFKHVVGNGNLDSFISKMNKIYKSDMQIVKNIGVNDLQICDKSGIDRLKGLDGVETLVEITSFIRSKKVHLCTSYFLS